MILLLLATAAHARPTDNTGTWSFSAEDEVTYLDSPNGLARVWYSVAGPNQVKAGDTDGNGLPDFAEEVGATTEDVLAFYEDSGFRAPLSDEGRGGTDGMDVYLVDFAGNADGLYSSESCTRGSPRQCSGYFTMENDFTGYGYSNLTTAIRILTSHELFHAVQAAYDADEEVWWSEGSAVWAEWAFDPGSEDFIWFADAYLDDTGRSLDEPPSGPVPTFAYATGLWWWFLADRYGNDVMVELLEATEADDTLLVDMAAIEEARGGSLWDDWTTFATWNLATGRLAGGIDGYPFADEIGPPAREADGASIVDDNRYYPLAATYYRLDHEGGPAFLALEADAPELYFSVHALGSEGEVLPALWSGQGQAAPVALGDLPAGNYWVLGTNATLADNSTKVLTCLGDEDAVSACAVEDTGDTGGDTGDTGDTGGEDDGGGCACGTGGDGRTAGFGLALAGLALGLRRRR